jgi:hypothetical protein
MAPQMNLDFLYEATEMTGGPRYVAAANSQADMTEQTCIRDDGTTYHVVDFDPHSGKVLKRFTHQGYAGESCWARGQTWAVYGYAQCGGWILLQSEGCAVIDVSSAAYRERTIYSDLSATGGCLS